VSWHPQKLDQINSNFDCRVGALTEARYAQEKKGDFFDEIDLPTPAHENGNGTVPQSSVKNLGWALFSERVQGLLEKKLIFSKRQWLYMLLQVYFPSKLIKWSLTE
jgi:hypothetical protein